MSDSASLIDRYQDTDLKESSIISTKPPTNGAKIQQDLGQSVVNRRLASSPALESALAIVIPRSDTLPHQLISLGPTLSTADSAIKGISKPHESDLAPATEQRSTTTSSEVTRTGRYITTSAGFLTPHASHASTYPLYQSDNLSHSLEEWPTRDSSNGSGSLPTTIMSRLRFDDLQAEAVLVKTRNAELERTTEKQKTTIQWLKNRTEQQDDEISEGVQKTKELAGLRNRNDDLLAKKARRFAEHLKYLKTQHSRFLAKKDSDFESCIRDLA